MAGGAGAPPPLLGSPHGASDVLAVWHSTRAPSSSNEVVLSDESGSIVLYNAARREIFARRAQCNDGSMTEALANPESCPVCGQAVSSERAFLAREYFRYLQSVVVMGAQNVRHDDSEHLHLGKLLNNGYYTRFFDEKEILGKGSFGVVARCTHMLDDLELGTYAVKKIPVGDDKNWLKKTLREVRTLERLQHPNIVPYKHAWLELHRASEFCPYVPYLFILMGYCDGGCLHDVIWPSSHETKKRATRECAVVKLHSGGGLPERKIVELLLDICAGLQHLHAEGFLHRDLKPGNILLQTCEPSDSSGRLFRALLSDFGTAELVTEATRGPRATGEARGYTGTEAYTAPELKVRGPDGGLLHQYDEAADMYSLGIVLYAMCYRSLPSGHIDYATLPWRLRANELESLIIALTSPLTEERPSAEEILQLPSHGGRVGRHRHGCGHASSGGYAPSNGCKDDASRNGMTLDACRSPLIRRTASPGAPALEMDHALPPPLELPDLTTLAVSSTGVRG
eukprot:TRINITY_DN111760_c0_g1_i1.p1 TRINITY_DN111760_c0_g1~~TRINITY_DN111760_c0_g1_i1.p1  ORF type:complete len:512 (-),score=57.49 TRINITY_DN111760_c0_g1_i1:17-1552(-)